jgi:hypothetical protein
MQEIRRPDFYNKAMHGYAVHEQTRAGYLNLLALNRSVMFTGTLALLVAAICTPIPAWTIIGLAMIFGFLVIQKLIENQNGTSGLFFVQDGRFHPHWQFVAPKSWRNS